MVDSDDCFVFTWKIADFSMLPHKKGHCLYSPVFTVDKLSKTNWKLGLFPRGDNNSTTGENYVSLFLHRDDFSSRPLASKVGFSLSFESSDNRYKKQQRVESHEFVDCNWGFATFCPRSYLFENQQELLPEDVLTITCRIWPSGENFKDNQAHESYSFRNTCTVATRLKVQKRSFLWPITNVNIQESYIKKISKVQGSCLDKSPSFKVLFYYGEGLGSAYSKIEIKLKNSNDNKESYSVRCKITVLGADKENQDSCEDSHFFQAKKLETWCFPDFIDQIYLDEHIYLVDNTLFLYFEFAFSCGKAEHFEIPSFDQSPFRMNPSLHLNNLSSNIQGLYASQKLCDVTLSVGEKRFPCHKLVLCAQSPVFAAMFATEMTEKNTGNVQIEDVDPETVNRMLAFMHSDVMEQNLVFEDTCNLYRAADKYQILPLKMKCVMSLLSTLCVANVCDILEVADTYQDNFLLANVCNFLTIHASETFRSSSWEAFMEKFPKFSGEVMLHMWKRRSEL